MLSRADLLRMMLIVVAAVISGCGGGGPQMVPITGDVRFEGEPVKEGIVTFFSPATGAASSAQLGPNGQFEIPGGLPAGEYSVAVSPPPSQEVAGAPTTEPPPEYPNIPQKYRSDTTTDLKATVTEESQEPFHFELHP